MNYRPIGGGYSESIKMLRFPLAVLVVFIHSFGPTIDVDQLHAGGLSGMAVYDYLRIFVSVVIARSAVPLFLFFSGFLLFKGVEQYGKEQYIDKLHKRWYSLIRPYLLWNLLCVLYTLARNVGAALLLDRPLLSIGEWFAEKGYLHILWDSSVWDERTTWLGTKVYNSGPALLPFWYMRDLMVMVVLSPLIYWLIKKLRFGYILLLLVVYLLDIRVPWYSNTIVPVILFFSLGAYFAIKRQDFTYVLWRWRYVICPLALVLIIVQTAMGSDLGNYTSRMIHLWLVLVQTLAFIIVASALCRKRWLYEWNEKLAVYSFFIYALHPFFLGYLKKIIIMISPMSDRWYMQCVDYLITPFICVAICIMVYKQGKRWLPGVMRLLTGERV